MTDPNWMLLLWIGLGAALMMALLFLIQRRTGNAAIVDVGWSFGLGASAVVYAALAEGDPLRRVNLAIIGGGWGLRLAWHIFSDRVLAGHTDGRYEDLKQRWGSAFQRNLALFFQAQALLVVVLSLPFLLAASKPDPWPGPFDILATSLWLVGIVGESIADMQLKRFKSRPDAAGRTCREGLWRYSRHPNYFFEWIIWLGFGALALGAPSGWLAMIAPALMLLLILKVTGIPPTEARAIASRGDDYRRYQRETSPFIPWFPKRTPA